MYIAGLLAQSERESAWREMAKQIAHEIKNPLTPMKLNVQHLQRTLEEGQNDPALVNRISATLIEQIDSLSAIANEAFKEFYLKKRFGRYYFLNPILWKEEVKVLASLRNREQAGELLGKARGVVSSYWHKR